MKLQQVMISCSENSNTLRKKRLFFSFSGFKKLVEKPGPVLRMIPKAEEGVTFNSVPSTEHGLQFHTYVISAITNSA